MISYCNSPCFLIGSNIDFKRQIPLINLFLSQFLEAELFERIGSVRNELADENFLIGVKRVDNDIKELTDFGLKRLCLRFAHSI